MLASPPRTFWQEAACSLAEPSPGLFANTQEPNEVFSAFAPTLLSASNTCWGVFPALLSKSSLWILFEVGTYSGTLRERANSDNFNGLER